VAAKNKPDVRNINIMNTGSALLEACTTECVSVISDTASRQVTVLQGEIGDPAPVRYSNALAKVLKIQAKSGRRRAFRRFRFDAIVQHTLLVYRKPLENE
jgi:hypothetical protein